MSITLVTAQLTWIYPYWFSQYLEVLKKWQSEEQHQLLQISQLYTWCSKRGKIEPLNFGKHSLFLIKMKTQGQISCRLISWLWRLSVLCLVLDYWVPLPNLILQHKDNKANTSVWITNPVSKVWTYSRCYAIGMPWRKSGRTNILTEKLIKTQLYNEYWLICRAVRTYDMWVKHKNAQCLSDLAVKREYI